MNNINNTSEQMKYRVVRLKEKTSQRLFRYIGNRTLENGERLTADEAINELLNAKGVE